MKISVWTKETDIPQRAELNENIETEVAVVGAGLAGILIAERLQSVGKKVVVLEACRIASGQTKNTTAKITAQHGCVYSDFVDTFGFEKTKIYAEENLRAVEWYRKYIIENSIQCDFETKKAYIYSLYDEEKIKKEVDACSRLGMPVSFTYKTDLPFKIAGAAEMDAQAQFNPLKFIKEVSKKLTIYENTPVIRVEGNILYCENAKVTAKHVVFACHFPFVNFPGLYFARMHQQRSYVLALKNAASFKGMYICVDSEGFSFRNYVDLLLLGGAQHRAGENIEGGQYDLLRQRAKQWFPESEETACWSAQDCVTLDGMPYIGRFTKSNPDWYVATGFGKWGMTNSYVSASVLTDLICKNENPAIDVFSPSRFSAKAAGSLANEVYHSAKGLIKQIVCIPQNKLKDIPIGGAGAVLLDGKKVGVYRESEDKYHCVKLRCPHLGCRLEWNPEEKSWDCPCHGSRFDYKGNLIDNPSQNNIKTV